MHAHTEKHAQTCIYPTQTAKMHLKFMTLAFLQGQAIYQILHILVSITWPIVESSYFSRFIWLGRGCEGSWSLTAACF